MRLRGKLLDALILQARDVGLQSLAERSKLGEGVLLARSSLLVPLLCGRGEKLFELSNALAGRGCNRLVLLDVAQSGLELSLDGGQCGAKLLVGGGRGIEFGSGLQSTSAG